MIVECPACNTIFPVDPNKVPTGGVHARCSVCSEVFFVGVPEPESDPLEVESLETPDFEPPAEEMEREFQDEEVSKEVEAEAGLEDPLGEEETEGMEETEEPEAAFVEPEATFQEPEPALEEPEATFEEPEATFEEPEAAFEEPEATFEEPEATFQEPEPALEQPEAAFEEPEPALEEPEAAFEEPDIEVEEIPEVPPVAAPLFGKRDPSEKAQRLARVLVSDIILYNPDRHHMATESGRVKEEFEEEIQKSWNEYVEQVGEEVANSTTFFNDALNEILAKGEQIF